MLTLSPTCSSNLRPRRCRRRCYDLHPASLRRHSLRLRPVRLLRPRQAASSAAVRRETERQMIPRCYTGAEPGEVWPLVRDYHYSGRMPSNIQRCYVAREPDGLFGDTGQPTAGIVFSIPPTRRSEPILELSRLVRSREHVRPLSELIAFACRWLNWRDFNLAVSFADFTQNHHGGVYQAAGWHFGGYRKPAMDGLVIDGAFVPGRSANSRYGTRSTAKLAGILPAAEIDGHWDAGKYLYWKSLHRS